MASIENALWKAFGLLAGLAILWMVLLVLNFASMVAPPLSPAEWWDRYRGYIDGEMKLNLGYGLVVILIGVRIKVWPSKDARTKHLKKADDEETRRAAG